MHDRVYFFKTNLLQIFIAMTAHYCSILHFSSIMAAAGKYVEHIDDREHNSGTFNVLQPYHLTTLHVRLHSTLNH